MSGDYDDSLTAPQETLGSSEQVTRFGPGALHGLGEAALNAAIRKPLLVADPFFVNSQVLHVAMRSLQGANVTPVLFHQVSPTPTATEAEAAGAAADGCDGVISLGGGSAIDVGKGAALLAAGGSVHGYGHGERPDVVLPHIACPSTAGTGAEQSHYAFFLELAGHEHTIVEHRSLVPVATIIDPIIHRSMSPHLTAATGVNALSDAIEAYLAPAPTGSSDKAALSAITGIAAALPLAFEHGDDIQARTAMARAAYEAGEAFTQVGLGLVDSISLVLSSLFSIGHSTANALVLPHVMRYQSGWAADRFPAIANALGVDDAVAGVDSLRQKVGLGGNLADRGLSWDDVYLTAHSILRHPFNARDPNGMGSEALATVLVNALGLDLVPPA